MSESVERYRRCADAFTATVHGVPPDAWESATPCEGWTARQLVRHVSENAGYFLAIVGEPEPDLPPVEADPMATWRASDDALRAVLRDRSIATKEFDGYLGSTTLEKAIDSFVSFDLVVHRWDLARATGQDERIGPADIEYVSIAAGAFGPALRSPNVCAEALEPEQDADEQTRLLAFLGRRA